MNMGSRSPSPSSVYSHFRNQREWPTLPEGYDWKTQIDKYCSTMLPQRLHDAEIANRKFGQVFCHRGFYDRAMKIPENSNLAIHYGMRHDLRLHEIDVRVGKDFWDLFAAHDESANRTTSSDDRWSTLSKERFELYLVNRHFNPGRMDLASEGEETTEKLPGLDDLLFEGSDPAERDTWAFAFKLGCLQLDLKGSDFTRALVYFRRKRLENRLVILKGYNFDFPSLESLEKAADAEMVKQWTPKKFTWLPFYDLPTIIMVFYSSPMIGRLLEANNVDPKTASTEDRLKLDYTTIYRAIRREVSSFIGKPGSLLIPEFVHSGLGLGYDVLTGKAVNPLDGTAIEDEEVIFESRVDRAMIEVQLEMKTCNPELYFSSCTRLCDVRTKEGEWVADMRTGKLRLRPTGVKGISTKLRGIHGGLYPQSDLVVADDPLAEIAARTWIDEYAELDRSRLLRGPFISYNDWLAEAGTEVMEAVNRLNGPFLPNTCDDVKDDSWEAEE